MKKIFVFRHAKASQTDKNIVDDHERTLIDKGIEQCKVAGDYLKKNKISIDHIISSTSVRTKETISLTLEAAKIDQQVEFTPKLYLAEAQDILNLVKKVSNQHQSIMLVGHNPGLHTFAARLINGGKAEFIQEISYNFPPGTLATIDFPVNNWSEITWHTGQLVDYLITKK